MEEEAKPSADKDNAAAAAVDAMDTSISAQESYEKLIEDVRKAVESFENPLKTLPLFIGKYTCTIDQCDEACDASADNNYVRAAIRRDKSGYCFVTIIGFNSNSTLKRHNVCTCIQHTLYTCCNNLFTFVEGCASFNGVSLL
jgi:hypothetical protein